MAVRRRRTGDVASILYCCRVTRDTPEVPTIRSLPQYTLINSLLYSPTSLQSVNHQELSSHQKAHQRRSSLHGFGARSDQGEQSAHTKGEALACACLRGSPQPVTDCAPASLPWIHLEDTYMGTLYIPAVFCPALCYPLWDVTVNCSGRSVLPCRESPSNKVVCLLYKAASLSARERRLRRPGRGGPA